MKNPEQKIKKNIPVHESQGFPKGFVSSLANEVAKTLSRMPRFRHSNRKAKPKKKTIENPVFLDTSAIIDGRIFDVIALGVFTGTFVILESILS